MSEYVMRVTIIVPQAMIADANQLALCLGQIPNDDQTFGAAEYRDAAGKLYSVASTLARATFPTAAANPLIAPSFAPDVDLDAARRAQAALVIRDDQNNAVATETTILAVIGEPASTALAAAGVTEIA